MAAESKTAVNAAFAWNIGLAALKGVAAAATGSAAMLAETLHSIADTGYQGLLFLPTPSGTDAGCPSGASWCR